MSTSVPAAHITEPGKLRNYVGVLTFRSADGTWGYVTGLYGKQIYCKLSDIVVRPKPHGPRSHDPRVMVETR